MTAKQLKPSGIRRAVQRRCLLSGQIVVYPSIADTANYGFSIEAVGRACRNTRTTYMNCEWNYVEDKGTNRPPLGRGQSQRKAVKRIDPRTGEETVYVSAAQAAAIDGFDALSISKTATGIQATHGGYKWEHV